MDTFAQMIAAVQSDLTVGDESTLYDEDTVKLALNRSYRKVGALYRWPELEDAKKTSTVNGHEYYDYPDTWRPDSIFRLEVDSLQYGEDPDGSPLTFPDYLTWRRDLDNENSTEKKWSSQWRRYFIFPVPTTNGNNNICIWGIKNVETLSADGDTTIFSYSMPEINEALVLEAVAILKAKEESDNASQFRSNEAKQIVLITIQKIKGEQIKYDKNQPLLEVDDMFSRRSSNTTRRGNFN